MLELEKATVKELVAIGERLRFASMHAYQGHQEFHEQLVQLQATVLELVKRYHSLLTAETSGRIEALIGRTTHSNLDQQEEIYLIESFFRTLNHHDISQKARMVPSAIMVHNLNFTFPY